MKRNVTKCLTSCVTPTVTPVPMPTMAAGMCIVFLTSLVANCLVIVVFILRPTLLSLSNKIVLNLILCNILTTILIMPGIIITMATGSWLLGDVWCQVSGFLLNVLFGASNLTLLTVSVDRYFAIVSPLHYKLRVTPSRCTAALMAVWMLSVCVSVPPLLGWSHISFQDHMMLCTVQWSGPKVVDRYYVGCITLLFFFAPLTVMLWTYVVIFCAARGNSQRTRRNSVLPAPTEDESSLRMERRGSGSVSTLRRLSSGTIRLGQQLAQKQGWKAAVTSFIVLLSFLVCWLPYVCVIVLEAARCPATVSRYAGTISILLAAISCTANPLVYVFRSRTTRTVLTQFIERQTVVQDIAGQVESRRHSDVSDIASSSLTLARTAPPVSQSSTLTLPGTSTTG